MAEHTEADVELVASVVMSEVVGVPRTALAERLARRVLDALTAAGWVRMDPGEPHLIEFRPAGWTIQHPVRCRPALFACPVNRVGEELPGPPEGFIFGIYECSLRGDNLVIGGRRDA